MNIRDNAIYSLSKYNNTIAGKIELAASTVPSQIILPSLIKEFSSRYKDISFSITQMDSVEVEEAVLNRQFEIGIIGTKLENKKLACSHLVDDKLVLITPNTGKYRDWNEKSIPFEQLAKECFIIREAGSGTRREFERIVEESGFSKSSINIVAQMNSIEAIKQSVSMGLGVSIVSLLSVRDYLNCGLLRAFDIEGLDLTRAFYVIHLKNKPLSPLNMVFLKYLNEKANK
jgi:DNA-binding transcriptional LysR family regulator